MQKLMFIKTAVGTAILTVYAFTCNAMECPPTQTQCPEDIDQSLVYMQKKPAGYTLSPREEDFIISDRQKLFTDSVDESGHLKKDLDGSIFGGGPCVSCERDGSIFGGGPCVSCEKDGSIFGGAPCNGPACRLQPKEKPNPKYIQNYIVFDDSLYQAVHRQCGDFAPIELEWVDFRIKNEMNHNRYSRNLGKYRFRIFGCRRNAKNAVLNEGRILEKDMSFIDIFDDIMSDCYHIIKTPNDLCLRADSPLPEYILTAEITDYYMNLCDEYDWDNASKKDKRAGSSEMTVVWRLMDLTKTNVLWKGKTVGYGEVEEGEYNGEIVLIERAFADAVDNLRNLPGFEEQVSKRVPAEEMLRQRNALIDMQRQMDPVKCQFSKEIKIMEDSGSVSSGYGMNENWIDVTEGVVVTEFELVDGEIIETSGTVISGSGIVEKSNSATGTVIAATSSLNDVEAVDPEPKDTLTIFESDSLCIMEQPDYDNMGPENVYKVRTAIVSVLNSKGKQGAGLLISEQFVMTSADLIDRDNNVYALETINGKKLKARAFRINPKKNTALLILDEPTQYTPLSLNLELPAVNKDTFMTLGLLDFIRGEGEGYLETGGKVSGYRYDEDGTSQIVIDTFVQSTTIGGVLINEKGQIVGMAAQNNSLKDGPDVFLPIETAMKSLGVGICGKAFPQSKPKPQKSWRQKSVAPLIENTIQQAPEAMDVKERK